MVTSLGCWFRYSGGVPQSPDCRSSYNVRDKMGESEMEDDRGIIVEV